MASSNPATQPQKTPSRSRLLDPEGASYRWLVAFTVSLSSFLVTMSQVAVQIALPQIMTVYGLNLDQAQWIVTAYVIAGVILVPAVGWLGNWFGNRTFYLLSLAVFVTTSMRLFLERLVAHRLSHLAGPRGRPDPAHDHDVLEQYLSP